MKQIALLACFMLLVPCLRSPPAAEAWSISGHEIIASRACRMFPGPWGEFLRHYEWLLNETVAYPDAFYKGRDPAESARHYVNLEIWNQSRPETGTLPSAVEAYGQSMSHAANVGDWNRMLLDAGRLAHYIADICQPYHSTVNYNPVTRSGTGLHAVLDGAIRAHLSEIRLISSMEGPQIVNFKEYALLLARESHGFLAEINSTLIDRDQPWSARLTEIIENRTNTAIVATTNVWYTAISASGAKAPALPQSRTLTIITRSTLHTIDVSTDHLFEFAVTDSIGVKIACEVRTEVAGIVLETEFYQELTDPLGSYRVVLPRNKLEMLEGTVEFHVIAQRAGYTLARLVLPIRVVGRPRVELSYVIYVSIVAALVMLLSFALLVREYRRQRRVPQAPDS